MPPDHDAANPVPIHWFPDRLVRYRSKTVLHTPTVVADSIRPQPDGREWFGERNQLSAIVLGFPAGEAKRRTAAGCS